MKPGATPTRRATTAASRAVTIERVRAIRTAPYGVPLVVVKVETSDPVLYGLGCATHTQRASLAALAVDEYLDPFLRGRFVGEIEDIWQACHLSSYWRSGPTLFNAISGVDQALWDIAGKLAGMPVHAMLGGPTRRAAPAYVHTSGETFGEVAQRIEHFRAMGFRHFRCQCQGAPRPPGSPALADGDEMHAGSYLLEGSGEVAGQPDGPLSPAAEFRADDYVQQVPRLMAYVRRKFGDEIELIHDVHEHLDTTQAVWLAKALEPCPPPPSPLSTRILIFCRQTGCFSWRMRCRRSSWSTSA